MMDCLPPRRLNSVPFEEDDDGAELRYVFVGKWEHHFDGRTSRSETRWVFDRETWHATFLEILDPLTLEWVCGTPEELSDLTNDLIESDAQFLEDLDEWRLFESDDMPTWACSQTELDERLARAMREQRFTTGKPSVIRLQLPRGRSHRCRLTVYHSSWN